MLELIGIGLVLILLVITAMRCFRVRTKRVGLILTSLVNLVWIAVVVAFINLLILPLPYATAMIGGILLICALAMTFVAR